jgi:hypothetical protein
MMHLGCRPGVADREHQYRHRIGIGGGDPGKSIFGAGTGLHGKDADTLAIGYPGEAVGDADADSFLAADDRFDAGRGGRFDQRVGGITGEKLHAFALEDFANRIDDSHRTSLMAVCHNCSDMDRDMS